MALDAIVVYDQDEAEIGKNVITDPGYQQFTSLIEAAHKIADNPEGETEYSYYQTATEQTITKKTYWRTIEHYGTQWRLVIAIPKSSGTSIDLSLNTFAITISVNSFLK